MPMDRRLAELFGVHLDQPWMDAGAGGPANQGINAPYVPDSSLGGVRAEKASRIAAEREAQRGDPGRMAARYKIPAEAGASVDGLMNELPAGDNRTPGADLGVSLTSYLKALGII